MKKLFLVLVLLVGVTGCSDSYRKTQETYLKGDSASWNPQTGAVTGAQEFKHTTWGDSEAKKIIADNKEIVKEVVDEAATTAKTLVN